MQAPVKPRRDFAGGADNPVCCKRTGRKADRTQTGLSASLESRHRHRLLSLRPKPLPPSLKQLRWTSRRRRMLSQFQPLLKGVIVNVTGCVTVCDGFLVEYIC